MGHGKQKKSATCSSTSAPPDTLSVDGGRSKDRPPSYKSREHHLRPSYPEQLNVEELISQTNYRTSSNEITNDSNNNSNSNNNTIHRITNQLSQEHDLAVEIEIDDVEKGPTRRHHRQKPLFRRLVTFIRNLWIGAKFNVGSDGKQSQ